MYNDFYENIYRIQKMKKIYGKSLSFNFKCFACLFISFIFYFVKNIVKIIIRIESSCNFFNDY